MVDKPKVFAVYPLKMVGMHQYHLRKSVGMRNHIHTDRPAQGMNQVYGHFQLLFNRIQTGNKPGQIDIEELWIDLPANHPVEASNHARLPNGQQMNAIVASG